jgi:predicted Zn-dependent protease with MMP-like domain
MHEVTIDEFTDIVRRAVDSLPPEFADHIANVDFAVEDWARPEDYARTRSPRGSALLGLYRGIPLTHRTTSYNFALPDAIVIFRGPLMRLASDADDLERRVRQVVRHEVAHYFGISDDRLREIDAY